MRIELPLVTLAVSHKNLQISNIDKIVAYAPLYLLVVYCGIKAKGEGYPSPFGRLTNVCINWLFFIIL